MVRRVAAVHEIEARRALRDRDEASPMPVNRAQSAFVC